ncbi:MAG TPA: CrcB family protein [Jatrophihabitans sp.]|jgi:CrcB protein
MLLIALGAAVGAPARYLTDRAIQSIQSERPTRFPWGTLTVNVLASLILGAVTGAGARLDPDLALLLGAGFSGALSTYSAFGYETLRLSRQGARWAALGNVGLSLGAGVGAAALGWWLAVSAG